MGRRRIGERGIRNPPPPSLPFDGMPRGAAARRDPDIAHPRPLIVAHRGAWDAAPQNFVPQNSLAAVERAIALGCDGIEIDVRRTSDGRLVLVHDARVRWRPVGRLQHHQVQARMQHGQAPLLDEVLAAAAGRILVDVEFKEDGYVAEAVRAVRRHLTPEQCVVTSFRPNLLARVRACAPELQTGLLTGARPPRDLLRRFIRSRANFLAPHVGLVHAGLLGLPWTQHLPLWVWTVNDDRALRSLRADPRVAALITDRPARALALDGSPVVGIADR